ncbi:QCR8 subunit 8 of ubiquinol cytochrome-c reductase complex [Agaricus bisporus var. burnettii JB137-S8]|uniref:Cytochrome b-c1 complex subunit 8 n=1 Tax=Agaricus bisporus var. burnettii (strain JB137-S8 / ATCC MYA-4627 / FGSC 10392) TaxID=597362 RepID=K5WSJ5_AGABU|nr:QCR8 subunit 8 of ubiquinol cytochrome-c reductase complex [Agaricus bisporus var. burnettii JB137-S8]EKM78391.1 QCR8 subunit 8 of ubiquinol cytochrome-c reductase complex [Agaricus bisporus var. burnettii JB137-S8]
MRPTLARSAEMPGPRIHWWGDKHGALKQKGITQYAISPWQTKAAPHMFRNYLFNGYRRISSELIFWVLPFGIGYGIYTWGKSRYDWQNTKAGHLAESAE